jgi:hypothetical protein
MSTITFECNVTEFDILPNKNNNENIFAINDKSLIINLMNNSKIIIQTEIEKKDAVELAKLILFKYNQ